MAVRSVIGAGQAARRWSFAGCAFDELSWTLTAHGQRVRLEAKPLELLFALLSRPGEVVSKDELLHAIWPDVTVVEASLPTAVYKLRAALGDSGPDHAIVETVSGVGYRLVAPVELELRTRPGEENVARARSEPTRFTSPRHRWLVSGLAAFSFAVFLVLPSSTHSVSSKPPHDQREALNALRRLDIPAIERMLASGWDPNAPINADGNGAMHSALEMCEWDRGHDRRALMLMVRTLQENGARIDLRNKWGDTPYSIAKAPRYCGPDHPATKALYASCYQGLQLVENHCLATYEIARINQHRGLTLPPKSR